MRWRLGASLLTVITAAIAVATAVLGPLYLHTAGDSVLRETVASAPVQTSGTTVLQISQQQGPLPAVAQAERIVAGSGGAQRWYAAPITTVSSGILLGHDTSQLFARTGICRELHFERGTCDLGPGDAVMTARGARRLGARLGSVVAAKVVGRRAPLRYRVTGIVATPDLTAPYWWGDGTQDFPFGQRANTQTPPTDPLITSQATALAVPSQEAPAVLGQLALRPGAVNLADETAVRHALARVAATLNRQGLHASTRLPSLLAAADHERRAMSTIVAVAATQLVLLAVWVLASALVRSSDARRSEARVARLRGFSGRSMLWVTAAEPGLLCLFGAILGVVLAWIALVIARAHLFVRASAIAFDGWTLAALALTLLAIVGALGVGTLRLLRTGERAESPARTPGGPSVASQIVDVVLIVLAVVALVALSTTGALNGHPDPIASAAPGLIALGTAVLAVGIILFACRLGISLTADSRWVGSFLALRQTARRPGVLRQARVLVIALCLACFAAVAWSVARSNRETTAEFSLGARTVVTVAPASASTLERAVAQVDPRRRFAMAVIALRTPGATLLAVDAPRLGVAATWPAAVSSQAIGTIARRIDPASHPAVLLADEPLRIKARATFTGPRSHVDLAAWLSSGKGGTGILDLGALHPGTSTYSGDLTGLCPGGCRLAGLGLLPTPDHLLATSGSVEVDVDEVASDPAGAAARPVAADLAPGGWRASAGGVTVLSHGHGLSFSATPVSIGANTGAIGSVTAPMVSPADHPRVLPVVATTGVVALESGPGPATTLGLDGNNVDIRPAAVVSALPQVGPGAVMADLDFLSDEQTDPTTAGASTQVWLGPDAPAGAVNRLRAAGLRPVSVRRSSTAFAQLQRSGPAFADDFLLIATIAALLVAVASTLSTLGVTTRERATELASLEVAGIPRQVLVRSLALETVILILTAVCGAGAGALAAAMAVSSLPVLSAPSFAPLDFGLPVAVLAAVTLAVLAAVALTSTVVTGVLVRRMSPALLRTVPDDITA